MDRPLKEGEFARLRINNDIYCGTGFNLDKEAEVFTGDESIMVPWSDLELISAEDVVEEILKLNVRILELEDALKSE